jgi:hypothetical protein
MIPLLIVGQLQRFMQAQVDSGVRRSGKRPAGPVRACALRRRQQAGRSLEFNTLVVLPGSKACSCWGQRQQPVVVNQGLHDAPRLSGDEQRDHNLCPAVNYCNH